MSVQPLFLDKPLTFEKIAGMKTKLSDNLDNWPQEIMQEAYKRLPFLSNFEVNVVLDRMDEQRGYAFGSIEVRSVSSLPEEQKTSKLSSIHIPFVVENQMMSPLDIFIHGDRYYHMSEGRFRAALFRPDMMDSPQQRPPDATFGGDLMPPATSGGFGSIGVKLGSALPRLVPLLPQLNERVLPEHCERIKQAMDDPSLKMACANAHPGIKAAFASASKLSPTNVEKTAAALIGQIRPDVVQVTKTQTGNYMVKWAAAGAFNPQQEEVAPQQAQQLVGQGPLSQQLETEGAVTVNPNAQISQDIQANDIRDADQFGLWAVQDTVGTEMVGWVFPHIVNLDLQPMPTRLFTNGSQYALQDMIAGRFLGKIIDLPRRPPQGYGSLYKVLDGSVMAVIPMTITTTFTDPSGMVNYVANTDMGEQVTFFFSDQVKAPTRVGNGQLIVPTCYKWLPLKAKTELVSDPSLFTKTANKKWSSTVELIGNSNLYSFEGPAVAKIASNFTKFVDRNQAAFMGVLMGMTPQFVKTALDRAVQGERVTVPGVKPIISLSEKIANARNTVRQELDKLEYPIRNYFLVKEASVLDDAMTADKILGLGFINAENISTFIDMLPGLEEASSKLAELLLAIRLGVKEVPEIAVERMLAALEDVIHGLKTLKQKELHF